MEKNLTSKEFREMVSDPKTESELQIKLAEYIRTKYPNVIFHSDFGSGIKMTIGQAIKNKKQQSNHKWLDMFIAEPRNGEHGLFLELKKKGTKLYNKKMEWVNSHIEEQALTINLLISKGYKASFAVGYENAISLIDDYMKGYDVKD